MFITLERKLNWKLKKKITREVYFINILNNVKFGENEFRNTAVIERFVKIPLNVRVTFL